MEMESIDPHDPVTQHSVILENYPQHCFSNNECKNLLSKFGTVIKITRRTHYVMVQMGSRRQAEIVAGELNGYYFDDYELGVNLVVRELPPGCDSPDRIRDRSRSPIRKRVTPPPYEVAIIAISRDVIKYAEIIRDKLNKLIGPPGCICPRPPSSHIMVLMSPDHVTPCIEDLTKTRVLIAIIINDVNWTKTSCTVRVLFNPPQREHRNMPLADALSLIRRQFVNFMTLNPELCDNGHPHMFDGHMGSGARAIRDVKAVAGPSDPDQLPYNSDERVIKPTKSQLALLNMLLNCRLLSVGELDELMDFLDDRRIKLGAKTRLTNRAAEANDQQGPEDNTVLRDRILDMLYPEPQNEKGKAKNTQDINKQPRQMDKTVDYNRSTVQNNIHQNQYQGYANNASNNNFSRPVSNNRSNPPRYDQRNDSQVNYSQNKLPTTNYTGYNTQQYGASGYDTSGSYAAAPTGNQYSQGYSNPAQSYNQQMGNMMPNDSRFPRYNQGYYGQY